MVSCDFEKFGGSYLISDANYEKYINGAGEIGRPDGQFMVPSNQMDNLLQNYPNNPREWERQLGLYEGSLGDSNIHRVDVFKPHDYEPRLPTKDLSGANDKFIPGGKTPGGQDECVINQFPNPEKNQSVGKISRIDLEQNNNVVNRSNNFSSNNATDKITDGGGARAPNQKSGTLPEQKSTQPEHQEPLNTNGRKPDASETVKNTNTFDNTICGTPPGNSPKESFDPKIEKPTGLATDTGKEGAATAQNAAAEQAAVPAGP